MVPYIIRSITIILEDIIPAFLITLLYSIWFYG